MKRPAIMAAIAILVLNVILAGVAMIILDQPVQFVTGWQQANYPTGIYDANVLAFFVTGWFWMSVIVLVSSSIWLYLRAQEDGRESP